MNDTFKSKEEVLGAIIITMENLNYPKKDIEDMVYECQYGTFDQYTAEQCREAHKRLN